MFANRNSKRRATKKSQMTTRKLRCGEPLEKRQLMAAEIIFDQGSGNVYVEGTDATRDSALIRVETRGTADTADDRLLVRLTSSSAGGSTTLTGNYRLSVVNKIIFNGYAGNDRFNNLTTVVSEADGGTGADILLGGFGKDVLYGGDQNDYLDGRTSNDTLYGGAHNDVMFGDKGNDILYGNTGHDLMFGGAGADSLWGEGGADTLDGGADTEIRLMGGGAVDTFIDDTQSYPGDFSSSDIASTTHSSLGMFDYNVADDLARSSDRLAAYLASKTPQPVNLNSQVLAFAQSKLGTKVGDGGCTRLLEAALEAVGAQPGSNFDEPGYYVWGRKLNAGEAMAPGEMIQFSPGTRFETANSWWEMDSHFGHAAIIESINGTTITMLNQNMSGSPVIRTTIDLATIVRGSYAVYQAIPK